MVCLSVPFQVENACYNINVRGKEVPKHVLKNAFFADNEDPGSNFQESGSNYAD